MRLRCPYCGHEHDKWVCDLFCGAGGAAMGYHRAGFGCVGIDNRPQPHYPFSFIQGDALNPPVRFDDFNVIHASPPCQFASDMRHQWNAHDHFDLLSPTRTMLETWGGWFVIENVESAPMPPESLMLCGTMFGLRSLDRELQRHRLFYSNVALLPPRPCYHAARTITIVGGAKEGHTLRRLPIARGREAMDIDWMNQNELSEAIPPAYTEWIGQQVIAPHPILVLF